MLNTTIQWFLNFIQNNGILAGLGAVGSFLIFMFTFYDRVAVPLYNTFLKPIVRFFTAIAVVPDRMLELSIQVKDLITEIKPNGGLSLKDSLHRLEEAFAVGEGQRLMLMNAMKEAVFLANSDGTNKWFNTAMLNLTGKNVNDLTGNSWVNAVYFEDRDFVAKEWRRAIQSSSNFDLVYRMYNAKTTEVFKVHTIATPIFCFRDKIVGYNGIVYRYPTEETKA